MQIIPAHDAEHLPAIRELFTEYSRTLDRDVCFRDFDRELAGLPGRYAPPEGRLLLAIHSAQVLGCVALRKLANDAGEIKRLFVRPANRGQGIGRQLAEVLIQEAREAGYARLQLDTLPSMRAALALYESLGFRRLTAASGCGCGSSTIDMELSLC